MVYHSAKNDEEAQQACGCSILPIVTTTRGPAPLAPEGTEDIIDEALGFFKANVLFKHFEVKGGGDRVMIYLTLYITQCLQRLEKCPSPQEGIKALTAMAGESFKIPGDAGFALGSFYPTPASAQEAELCRSYFRQVREETGRRLITKVYGEDGSPSKFWLVFAKKKFMNKVRAYLARPPGCFPAHCRQDASTSRIRPDPRLNQAATLTVKIARSLTLMHQAL
jgi:actin related protein 2/3 complex subunit 3